MVHGLTMRVYLHVVEVGYGHTLKGSGPFEAI